MAFSFMALVWYLGLGGILASIFMNLFIFDLAYHYQTMEVLAFLLTPLRKVWFWAEKTKVASSLQSTIGLSSQKLNEEGMNLLPHGIEIKWVEPMERDAFLEQDKVVVCLESSYNEARNLARATMLYVQEDLIHQSRRFVHAPIMKSIDLVIAKKMLSTDRKLEALRCLSDEFIAPELNNKPAIQSHMALMERIDEQGLLTRLLLREFSELDTRLLGAVSDERAVQETRSFTQKVKELVEKEKGVDVYPIHMGKIICVSIMPVAREDLAGQPDPTRYVNYAKKCSDDGFPTLYVVARGLNVFLAEWSVEEIEKRGLYKEIRHWKFKMSDRKRTEGYVAFLSRIS
jgi:hypothetical protein